MRKATLLGNCLVTSDKVGTLFFQLDCHVMLLIYYELIQYTSRGFVILTCMPLFFAEV